MFTAALFTIAETWKCCSDTKQKGILPFTTTWMAPETVTLSDTSWTEKDKYCVI